MMELNKYIDHTLLKADATEEAIVKLCEEAQHYQFKSVCINPDYVSLSASLLQESDVEICTVIGFPLGSNTSETKVFEAKDAVQNGATEIDMVLNISKLKDGHDQYVEDEIRIIKEAIGSLTLKVILETSLLSDAEIIRASNCAKNAGANFIKTSTGFSTGGATVAAVRLMKDAVGDALEVKASGGIRSYEAMLAMIEAGATRIGTSSGVAIMQGEKSDARY